MIQLIRFTKWIFVVLTISVVLGCSTMNSREKVEYSLMEKDGVLVEEKSPGAGAALGILPGGGAFYGRAPAVGVVDLLLWPLSILWDPIVGYETSKKVNYDITVADLKRKKDKALSVLDDDLRLKLIDAEEYTIRKRQIERKYEYAS